jgi:Fur family peroxide stress response transcriptional regulator
MDAPARRRRFDEFERRCREGGMPLTVQRRAILDAVLSRDDHPTADQVFDSVRRRLPGVSRATVYRTLDTFVGLGVVALSVLPGPAARFDRRVERHHHLLCVACERAIDVVDARLDALPVRDTFPLGFEIVDVAVLVRGLCRSCRESRKGAGRAPVRRRARPKAR